MCVADDFLLKISDVAYEDVAVHGGFIYAVQFYRPRPIDVYEQERWRHVRRIEAPCGGDVYDDKYFRTHSLCVTDEHILLCCAHTHRLYTLSHNGTLFHVAGKSLNDTDENDVTAVLKTGQWLFKEGVLFRPRVCHADNHGSVLISDTYNHRIQVMTTADDLWSVVDVTKSSSHTERDNGVTKSPNHPGVADDVTERLDHPRGAVWWNQRLYVLDSSRLIWFS